MLTVTVSDYTVSDQTHSKAT